MVPPCKPPRTNTDKIWPYHEYYIGERDKEQRKNGLGSNFWSGAESLECYTGQMLRETMHGDGEYRFRHREDTNLAVTYEGYFYNNYLHGYGLMSYPNGRVFSGIYHSNLRWGPGVETFTNLTENVGLWEGTQLVRLTWKPESPSVIPDLLSTSTGRHVADQNRTVLVACTKTIGESNPALELLKQCGADPLLAEKRWRDLYPKNCTDKKSWFYHGDVFERAYYHNYIETLEEYTPIPDKESRIKSLIPPPNRNTVTQALLFGGRLKTSSQDSKAYQGHVTLPLKYYAWNNNELVLHMMKHCYQHEKQRPGLKLAEILRGPRYFFKPPAQHELDCRTILMACFLGHINNVAQLINEFDVSPNVTDMQGNSPIMYAACGNHTEIIRFLVEAGGRINDFNDACCTALGIVLIQYACAQLDIPPSTLIQAILPPGCSPAPLAPEETISEWLIERDLTNTNGITKKDLEPTANKGAQKAQNVKKNKSIASIKVLTKTETQNEPDPNEITSGENKLYFMLSNEYFSKVCDIMKPLDVTTIVPYMFEVSDMVREIDTAKEEPKKPEAKKEVKNASSKNLKVYKISREIMPARSENFNAKDETKTMLLAQIMSTIKQLLLLGAEPRLVRCPQPALFIATVSCCPEVVRILIGHGANVNEVYPQALGYMPLDIAVAGPMTRNNLEIIRTLLENGANANHRLPTMGDPDEPAIPGPTLLNAVIAKKKNGDDEDIRYEVIELLLDYGCDPTILYRGQSAMDMVMSRQLGPIFDIIIENPYTNLNGVINESDQSILMKMFFLPYCRTIPVGDRLQMLTNLLLFGADPLLRCRNGEIVYNNLFEYANEVLTDFDKPIITSGLKDAKVQKQPSKQKLKPAKEAPKSTYKAMGTASDDINDYKQCLSLVNDCARLLFIRWLQSKLMNELILVVKKYEHRHWNMIIKENKNKGLGIWLYPVRCLEIWDVLKSTKSRIYNDKIILKYVLYIVHYYNKIYEGVLKPTMTSQEKATIESEVAYFMHEHKTIMVTQRSKRPYVMPELTPKSEIKKFNICFECALPLNETNMRCNKCKLIYFCGLECMRTNIGRSNCHPCSNFLKKKYFQSASNSGELSE